MFSTLIGARFDPPHQPDIAKLFGESDSSDVPERMGTLRRQLIGHHDLYSHLQNFTSEDGKQAIEAARTDPRPQQISADMRPFVEAYDPVTWRSPADAMATGFYHRERS
ncbi:TcmI family type II polyketide cyclase [Lentzea sp.]|uniref:TcmI family type II polyketide cyclase n=1 Tax=Lentzea sp. TaxID=56099 RepID=UPI002CD83868|nr:TcmI family type II polyketide cyclase [Lentzea sp.]HUQ55890.1 TcmI family type II polyketide cyclase [Lentzea sp.]